MIILAGASASGKTEVAKELAKTYGITKVITTTTRDKRVGEKDGKDYFFVSKPQFENMLREDRFVEHTIYNDNFYGSTKDQISTNKCIVVDPAGLRAYSALNDPSIITFFLEADEDLRFKRMIERGDELEKAKKRLAHDRIAFDNKKIQKPDYHIDSQNFTIEEVAKMVYDLYQSELKKRNIK